MLIIIIVGILIYDGLRIITLCVTTILIVLFFLVIIIIVIIILLLGFLITWIFVESVIDVFICVIVDCWVIISLVN